MKIELLFIFLEIKMDESLKILVEYPLIVPSQDRRAWEGYIKVKMFQFPLRIMTPNFPSIEGLSISSTPEIAKLVRPQIKNMSESISLMEVLNAITHLCKLNIKEEQTDNLRIKEKATRCKFIIRELQKDIGEENIVCLEEDLEAVKVSYIDQTNDKHLLTFSFADYPKFPLLIKDVDLPSETKSQISGLINFRQLYQTYSDIVESLVPFWNLLKEIEEHTWVIDPQHPQKKDSYRRIFLDDDLSVIVTLNPFNPTDIPDLKFLGTINASENKRKIYFKNLQSISWSTEQSILENLKKLLEIDEFPARPVLAPYEGMLGPNSCCICFSDEQEANQSPPTKWCNNSKCNSRYHLECILHWFESLPNIQRFFTYVSGPCPYCGGKVLCPVDDNRVI